MPPSAARSKRRAALCGHNPATETSLVTLLLQTPPHVLTTFVSEIPPPNLLTALRGAAQPPRERPEDARLIPPSAVGRAARAVGAEGTLQPAGMAAESCSVHGRTGLALLQEPKQTGLLRFRTHGGARCSPPGSHVAGTAPEPRHRPRADTGQSRTWLPELQIPGQAPTLHREEGLSSDASGTCHHHADRSSPEAALHSSSHRAQVAPSPEGLDTQGNINFKRNQIALYSPEPAGEGKVPAPSSGRSPETKGSVQFPASVPRRPRRDAGSRRGTSTGSTPWQRQARVPASTARHPRSPPCGRGRARSRAEGSSCQNKLLTLVCSYRR